MTDITHQHTSMKRLNAKKPKVNNHGMGGNYLREFSSSRVILELAMCIGTKY